MAGVERERAVVRDEGVVPTLKGPKGLRLPEPQVRVPGPNAKDLVVVLDVPGIQSEHLRPAADRLLRATQARQRVPLARPCFLALRVRLQGAVEGGERLVRLPPV